MANWVLLSLLPSHVLAPEKAILLHSRYLASYETQNIPIQTLLASHSNPPMNPRQLLTVVNDHTREQNLQETVARRVLRGSYPRSISENEEAERLRKEAQEKYRAQLNKPNAANAGTNRDWMIIGHFLCGLKPLTPWEETFSLFFLHCFCMEIHPRSFTVDHAREEPLVEKGYLKKHNYVTPPTQDATTS